jgi:hypothetical protein
LSAYEIVSQTSKKFEKELKKYGGEAKGAPLHEYINSIEHGISSDYEKKLRYLASTRNKLMHEEDFEMDHEDIKKYKEVSEECFEYLASSSHDLETAFTVVMKTCKKIESRLKNDMGAEGKGLIQYANFLSDELPESIFHYLEHIGRVRNALMHDEESYLTSKNVEEFKLAAEEVFIFFESLKEHKIREQEAEVERQREREEREELKLQRDQKWNNIKQKLPDYWFFLWSCLLIAFPLIAVDENYINLLAVPVVIFCFIRGIRKIQFICLALPLYMLLYLGTDYIKELSLMLDRSLIFSLIILAVSIFLIKFVYKTKTRLYFRKNMERAWLGIYPLLNASLYLYGMMYIVNDFVEFSGGGYELFIWVTVLMTTSGLTVMLLRKGLYRYNLCFPIIVMIAEFIFAESNVPAGLFLGSGILVLLAILYKEFRKSPTNKEEGDSSPAT